MKSSGKSAYYRDTPMLQDARDAWSVKDYRQSLRLFERAVKREPFNLMALKDAAYAFGQSFEISTATRYIKRMETLVGNDAGALHVVADAWRDAYRPNEAWTALKKAVDTGHALPETYLSLALVEERAHHLDAAMEFVDRFLKEKPNEPEGLRMKALILRRMGEVDEAKEIYKNLTNFCGKGDQMVLAQGLNEWAQILDKEQDYEAAFEKMEESKSILKQCANTKGFIARERQERGWFNGFLDTLTADHINHWISSGGDSLGSQVMLTGCPRSGTTLIEKVLDAHSGIISAEELSVFSTYAAPRMLKGIADDDLNAESLDVLPRSLLRRESRHYYRSMEAGMNEKIQGRTLIDKTPSNTMMIPLMMRMIPETQVIYALRDPRDIVISCYFCWMEQNSVSMCFLSLEETVERTVCELEWWLRIKEVLPEARWCETRYEDTVNDLIGESRRLTDWMGLTWEEEMTHYRDHLRKRGVSSPTYESVNQPVYRGAVERWKNYEKSMEPHMEKIEAMATKLGY